MPILTFVVSSLVFFRKSISSVQGVKEGSEDCWQAPSGVRCSYVILVLQVEGEGGLLYQRNGEKKLKGEI